MDFETGKYDLSKIDSDKYWELVRKTLGDIFHKNPNDAQSLENEVRNSSPDEQVLFYHGEPLSTASGIAEKVPTQQDIKKYKALRAGVYSIP